MTPDTRTFGGWLLIGVDALIMFSLLFMCIYMRVGVAAWPDVPVSQTVSPLIPALAALAAVLGRFLAWLAIPAFILAAVSVWEASSAGLGFGGGRYGPLFYAFAGLWALHLLGASIALTWTRGPWLRRFLLVQGVAGGALMASVLV